MPCTPWCARSYIVLILDTSGSMQEKLTRRGGETRLERMVTVIQGLSKTWGKRTRVLLLFVSTVQGTSLARYQNTVVTLQTSVCAAPLRWRGLCDCLLTMHWLTVATDVSELNLPSPRPSPTIKLFTSNKILHREGRPVLYLYTHTPHGEGATPTTGV